MAKQTSRRRFRDIQVGRVMGLVIRQTVWSRNDHLFHKYLLNTCYVPSTVPDLEKTSTNPVLIELTLQLERQTKKRIKYTAGLMTVNTKRKIK